MRYLKLVCLIAVVSFFRAGQADAQGFGIGTRIASLPIFKRANREEPATTVQNDSRAVSGRNASPTPPQQSELTFPRSPLAPQPSVTIPAPVSPAGNQNGAASNNRFPFGNRLRTAANAARERLTIKPRVVAVDDPISLNSAPKKVEAPLYVAAARLFEKQGRMDKAREQYEKALAVNSKDLEALVGFARLQHREGDLVSATELYQRAIKAHPDNPVALNDLGLCYARRGMTQQAEQTLRKAVQRDSRSKLYRNNLALVLVEMGRDDEALRHLNAVHGPAIAEYNMAYMLKEKGRTQDAARHLQTALRRDPQLEPARQLLASLQPAQNRNRTNQPNGQQLDTAFRTQPPSGRSAPVRSQPVRVRFGDNGSDSNGAARSPSPVGQQSAQPLLRRAPLPGDLPDYLNRDPAPQRTPSRWD